MGDMKTPDFDDLLAAFDIPDPTSLDAKETIQSTGEENENHLKPSGICIDENVSLSHSVPAPDIPVVSVIVKNTSRQESFEAEKEGNPLGAGLLHNGFRGSDLPSEAHNLVHNFGKFDSAFINGDSLKNYSEKLDQSKSEPLPTFSQFSPISSPEPEDAFKENSIDDNKPKHAQTPYFPPTPMYIPSAASVLDSLRKVPEPELSMFDQYCKKEQKMEIHSQQENRLELSRKEQDRVAEKLVESSKDLVDTNNFLGEGLAFGSFHNNNLKESRESMPEVNFSSSIPPRQRLKPAHSKLSSCVAALVALQAKKVACIPKEDQTSLTKEPSGHFKDGMKGSPKMPKSPKSPRSPLEVVKKTNKQPESPRSVCSDSSGKGSPSVAAGSPPAIPKVRIKTIKMSSGEIKRTVTRILPEAEELGKSPEESSAEGSATEEFTKSFPSPDTSAVMENEASKSSTKNAAATAIQVSNVASPCIDDMKTEITDNSTPKVSSSPLPNCGSDAIKIGNVGQQPNKRQHQDAVTQPSNPTTSSLLPKAVHLANLNLVPHSVAASVTAKSSVQRRSKPQLTQMSVPLVHQVKKAAPVIVEEFNKVLNSNNLVSVYSPNLSPPPDSNIQLPASGYCCLECGDSFALEKSLTQHYSRRSVHIEVMCTQCSTLLLFFNKCSLLKHAREHKSKGLIMQCSQLLMKPISLDEMFSASTNSSVSLASQTLHFPAPSCKPSATSGSGTGTSINTHPAMPLYADPLRLIRHGLKCLECNKQAQDYVALAAHFQRTSEDNEGLTCQVCQMMLPNQCCYCAHQRIHTHKSPYCCPECGTLCRSAHFQTHVKENCLHYSRKVGYRCIHCGVVFMSLAMLKVHIHEKHCEVFHKCSFCPMAFKSADSTTAHITSQHPEEPHKTTQVIYKCSCETVFNKKKLLQEHFQQNANKLLVGVFKCPQCQLVYMQKQQLMQHVKAVHGVPPYPEDVSNLRQKPQTTSSSQVLAPPKELSVPNGTSHTTLPRKDTRVENNSESKPILKSVGWTCRECSQWNPDRENYVSHMKKSHGKSVKRYPCRQCEHSFNDFSSLGRHIRNNHDTAKKVYTCWFCTDENRTFPQPSMLENHISLMHGIKNPDLSQMSKAKAPECDSTKAKSPKRVSADAPGQMETTEVPPAKKLKAHWKCAKCGFATDISTEFQEHIPQHKADNSTSQCLLCGLCYTSHISLNRHLFIVHKVKDPVEEEEEEEEEREKLQTETNENGHEEYNRETNTTVEGEENSLKCKKCKSDSVLCAHSQRCGVEDSSSNSHNNHSNATKI
ncbi:zinc finger protein 592 isoform X2 [Dermochelys coriacea]|uniref:zinc finger protein 592 isoform X2 n=1 Tax=Dermochelys coriacea TaxID=27794 RepID=UPI0018E90351|nr:zinc finger protein 592 isoform X2 [Dermochelys coriacea]XP_043350193.1 zinc finger protein 592 isoform X2 [Dermochelys coriacea]